MKKFITVKTNLGIFQALFESNAPEKGYTVTVPKLRGVVTCGDTLAAAKRMVREAIELHCSCLLEEGMAEIKILNAPKPRELAYA
ncbi:MAG: type II toxin-antitoxin system HicB family antitoxin [Candidatus Sungiibacteriota bacterium]